MNREVAQLGWLHRRRPGLIRASAMVVVAWISAVGPVRAEDLPPVQPTGPAVDAAIASITQLALEDAARRTKIERGQLVVVTAEAVLWSNGSFGCPQDDTLYTQAPVPGFRIRIRAADELLDYHAGVGGKPFLCPAGRAVDPLPERLMTTPVNPDTGLVTE